MSRFTVKFWGVRGSIASPGPETVDIGGNTSCVELACGDETLILDAGTGLRRLGHALLARRRPVAATLLLSHFHWDHIQGLPFFVPAYLPETELTVVGAASGIMSLRETLVHQMTAPVFPVRLDELSSKLLTRNVRPGECFSAAGAEITVAKGNHPGGVHAYRIDYGGHAVVYATDIEHYACTDPGLVALARNADVLIYDAQYTQEEYEGVVGRAKVGWGHSTNVAAAELAAAAGIGHLYLFHHDPSRSDEAVRELEAATRRLYENATAAREGMSIELSSGDTSAKCSRAA